MSGIWSNDRYTDSSIRNLDKRAAVAAKFVTPDSSVLDMGCGLMLIRKHLPPGVAYSGYDRHPVLPDAHNIDLDAHEFPDGRWDYVVLLGVLPWIRERSWTLAAARRSGRNLIVTRKDERFDDLIASAGWVLERKLLFIGPVHICLYG